MAGVNNAEKYKVYATYLWSRYTSIEKVTDTFKVHTKEFPFTYDIRGRSQTTFTRRGVI